MSVNAVTSVWLLLKKQSLLHRCLHQSLAEDAIGQKTANKLSKNLAFTAIAYICLELALECSKLFSIEGRKDLLGSYFPKLRPDIHLSPVALLGLAVDALFRKVLILGPAQLSVSLFVVLVHQMTEKFRAFNKFFETCALSGRQLDAAALR